MNMPTRIVLLLVLAVVAGLLAFRATGRKKTLNA